MISHFYYRVNTADPVHFTLVPPECHMEIRAGYGAQGPRVTGPVHVGDPLTLLINMRSQFGKSSRFFIFESRSFIPLKLMFIILIAFPKPHMLVILQTSQQDYFNNWLGLTELMLCFPSPHH